jgi:hypothetical protein
MAERIARGWFQCPDTGDEVVVEVFAAPCRATVRPTSRLVDANDPHTEVWCGWLYDAAPVGLAETVTTLRQFGVGRRDVNWEDA